MSEKQTSQNTFVSHLSELRSRLVKSFIFLIISSGVFKKEKCQPPSLMICVLKKSLLKKPLLKNLLFLNHCGDFKCFLKQTPVPSHSFSL